MSTGPGGDTSWYWVNPLPQGNGLLSQSWVDANHGWAVGTDGVVLKTSDGGTTWAYQDPKTSPDQRVQKDFNSTVFTDVNTGWIVGGNGLAKKTLNGGSTWTTVTLSGDLASAIPKGIAAYNGQNIIVVAQSGMISYTSDGGSTWQDASTNPAKAAGTTLQGVCWADATTAFAVGDNGMIIKTTNGGQTWTQLTSGVTGISLFSVSFAPGSNQVGIAVGNSSGGNWTVLRTVNGGSSWSALPSQVNLQMFSASMLDANTAVICGANGTVYKTTSFSAPSVNSVAWSNLTIGQASGAQLALRSIKYIDSTHLSAVGDNGVMFLSADAGLSWRAAGSVPSSNLMASCLTDSSHVWMAGAAGVIQRTTNGGSSWIQTNVGTGTWRGISFSDASNGWVVGDSGAIRHTTDGGVTWTAQTSGTTQQLNGVWFNSGNSNVGFAVGAAGTILYTTNGGTTWTSLSSGSGRSLTGVYFQDAYHGWVVGAKSTVLYVSSANSGSTWSVTSQNTPQNNKTLNAIRGVPGTSYVWIVGNSGLMWTTTNGSTWANQSSLTATSQNLYSVYYANTVQGWIGGANGTVSYWVQAKNTFAPATNSGMPAGTTLSIHSLAFADTNTGYYAADSGIERKSSDGGATWVAQQYGTYAQLNAVTFADSLHGWIAGNNGVMLSTLDGGNSWFSQTVSTNANLFGVAFANPNTGWAAGGNGAITYTTNGGNSWVSQTSGTTQQLNNVACPIGDASHAIAVGNAGTIRYTTNGGSTWTSATAIPALSYGDAMLAVAFPPGAAAGTAFLACNHTAGNGHPGILKTTDYGATWTTATVGYQPVTGLSFAPAPYGNIGWACGALGAMYYTNDGGTTWTSQTTPLSTSFQGVSAATSQSAYAVGVYGFMAQTSNGGATWLTQNSGLGGSNFSGKLNAIAFPSANNGYTVGSSGAILRTTSQIAPVTSLLVNPATPDGLSGWYAIMPPEITLAPDQQAQPYYSWDATAGPFTAYTGSVTAAQGVHTLYYYSVNAANKQEVAKSATFLTDLDGPSAPATPSATPFDRNTVQVSWNPAVDALSGVDHYELYYQLGAGPATLAATTSPIVTTAYATGLTPNTTYSFWVQAADVAGNMSASSTVVTATTYSLPPLSTTVTPTPLTPNGLNGWYVSTPTVTLTSYPTTVSAYTYYAWDSAALTTYTIPFAMPTVGQHTLSFWSLDRAGQRGQETTQVVTYKLDNTSPIAPNTVSASGDSTSSLQVSWSGASDSQSGIDHYDLWVGGVKYGTYAGTSATVSGLAVHSTYAVYVVAVNAAGLSSVSSTVYGTTLADPAVSTVAVKTPASADGTNGWYITSPTVSLSSVPTSVPAWIYYAWDGAAATTYTPGAQIAMPGDGSHTLSFASADKLDAGNREATQTLTLKRDSVAPSAPTSVIPGSLDTTTIAVTWTLGSDASSGVDHYNLYMDSSFVRSVAGTSSVVTGLTPNTLHSFAVASVDGAGNVGTQTVPVWAATNALPPLVTTAAASPITPDGINGWYVTTPTVTFSVSPAVTATTYFGWDGSALTTATGAIAPPSLGTHTLSFWSVDSARQRANEATQQLTYKLDTTAPSHPTVTVTPASTTSLAVSWTSASDAQSGIDSYAVYVDGSIYATYSPSATSASVTGLNVHRAYTIRVDAIDGAGLTASDSANPSTLSDANVYTNLAISPSSPNGTNGWYVTAPPLIALTGEPLGVSTWTYYAWDGSALTTYSIPVAPSDGVHTLTYYSVDQADPTGNRETTRTLVVSVDTAPPSAPLNVYATTLNTTAIGVSWSLGGDSGSGVDHYDLYVDGVYQGSYTATGTAVTGLTPNSLHSFRVVTVDRAGNQSAASSAVEGAAAASEALSTMALTSPSSPDGTNGWYVHNPQITLLTTPATVTANTYYGWDGSALSTYINPFAAPGDGEHTLYFWSVDAAHQHANEATEQVTYHIDTTAPSAPANVAASAATTTSLAVTWDAASDAQSGIDHYEVLVDGVSRGSFTGGSATVGGLAVNHTYSVAVKAVNGAGLGKTSDPVSVTTAADPAISTNSAASPSTADGQNGWYVTTPTVTLTTAPSSVPADTFYRFDSAAATLYSAPVSPVGDGVHTLQFYSVDRADATNHDTTSTLTLKLDTTPPTPPSALDAAAVDTTSVALAWTLGTDAASGVDHYVVWADGAPYGSVSATGTTVTGLTPNALHTFVVYAVDAAGNESYASPATTAVTGAFAALTTTAHVTPSSADGINGWYVTTPTVTFTVAPAEPANTYYAWDTDAMQLVTGAIAPPSNGQHKLYFWSVDVAHHHANEATQEIDINLDALPDVRTATGTPVSIAATKTITTSNSTNLVWTPAPSPVSGTDHYEVWDEYVGSTSGTSFLVSGLTPLTAYGFKIYGVSGAGTYFSQSDTVTVETSAPPKPVAPTVVAATAPDGGFVNIAWQYTNTYVGAVGYHVWRSNDGASFSQVATLTGQYSNVWTDTGLRSSTRYYYAVSTFDDRGESVLSDVSTPTWSYTAPVTGRPERVIGVSSSVGSGTVMLSWTPAANPAVTGSGYLVTRGDQSMAAATTMTPTPVARGASPSWEDTSVVNGQTYYYRVYPVDASGTVGFGSLEVEAKPLDTFTGADIHVVKKDLSSASCAACHSQHRAPAGGTGLGWVAGGPNEDTTCLSCHAAGSGMASTDTSSEVGSSLNRSAIPMWTPQSTGTTMTCDSCHRAINNETSATAGLLGAGGVGMSSMGGKTLGDQVCYTCHGTGSTLRFGDMSGFENSVHTNVPSPASGSQVKCQACHESHASRNDHMVRYDGAMLCLQCHSQATGNPNEPDVWSKLTLNDAPNSKHPLLAQDQKTGARMTCENCHNTHSVTANNPLVDPHNPSPTGVWMGNLAGDEKTFCFRCHNGSPLPTSAETTPWADAVLGEGGSTTVANIQDAYMNYNVHGLGAASDPATTTLYLRQDMGYLAGDALDCSTCHDPHGTPNNYALVSRMKSANAQKTVTGLLVYQIPAGSITPTSPVGYDLRFFCSSCHLFDPATHDPMADPSGKLDTSQFGKTDCTRCHRHVKSNGQGSTRL